MDRCHLIDLLVTPFIDGACSPEERQLIAAHLGECGRCRQRVEAETAASSLLQAHASMARAAGIEPAWRPVAWRLGRPVLPVHRAAVGLALTVLVAVAVGLWSRPLEASVVGVIGDSFCRLDHHQFTTRFNVADHDCTRGCVERGASFVLVADGRVYQIRNQELPELRALAAARVRVSGRIRGEAITISSIAPLEP